MKKAIRAKEESNVKSAAPAEPSTEPLPQYLLDRSNPSNAKALSSAIKNKRKESAARFSVPIRTLHRSRRGVKRVGRPVLTPFKRKFEASVRRRCSRP